MPLAPTPCAATWIEVAPDLVLDARRAVWLPGHRMLVVADTHLGYAWVQRARGQLLPVATPETTVDRLAAIAADHGAASVALLGDVVHAALDLAPLRERLERLAGLLGDGIAVHLVAGNHDRRLAEHLAAWGLPLSLERERTVGRFRLVHGDADTPPGETDGATCRLSGHEHPAIRLGDGIAHSVKVPAFLTAPGLVVLPAFSDWAAGSVIGHAPFLSPLAQGARFQRAVACVGNRLLSLPVTYQGDRAMAGGDLPAVTSRGATSPSSGRRPRRSPG